jgi:hypothetical protein
MTCLARMRRDQRTKEYVARRTAEGKSKPEIIRCLKRYLAREVYRVLISCGSRSSPTALQESAHTSPPGAAPLDHRSVTPVNRDERRARVRCPSPLYWLQLCAGW